MIVERTFTPSATTAAAVSSQDVSIPKINTAMLPTSSPHRWRKGTPTTVVDIPSYCLTCLNRFAVLLDLGLQKIDGFLQLRIIREVVPWQLAIAPVTRSFLITLLIFRLLGFLNDDVWGNTFAMDLTTFRCVVFGSSQTQTRAIAKRNDRLYRAFPKALCADKRRTMQILQSPSHNL